MKRDLEDTYICHFIQFHQFMQNVAPLRSLGTHGLGRCITVADLPTVNSHFNYTYDNVT